MARFHHAVPIQPEPGPTASNSHSIFIAHAREKQAAQLCTKHGQSDVVGLGLLLHTARGVIPPPGQVENYVLQAVLTI